MRYNRANLDSTMKAALHLVKQTNKTAFISANHYGYIIEHTPPIAIGQSYYRIDANPNSQDDPLVEERNTWIDAGINPETHQPI